MKCNKRATHYFLLTTLTADSQIEELFNPYLSISSNGVPDSPKVSLVPTNSCGAGIFVVSNLETLSPSPPKILCSSADTRHPV